MVIFGAGASYDSAPLRPLLNYPRSHEDANLRSRPPLANELFGDHMRSIGEIKRFSHCQPIIPYLQGDAGKSVEAELERLREEAAHDSRRLQQLAAIRYYLQFMLSQCERVWKHSVMDGISNFKTLLDQIEHSNQKRPVCLVTFNYDTLIEESLSSVGIKIQNIGDYISSGDYKLIKLHGSVNWGRKVEIPVLPPDKNAWAIVSELTEAGAFLKLTDDFFVVDGQPIAGQTGTVLFPAVAIPVETKKSYECPKAHLDCLSDLLPKVTKVLMIGWRGAEDHFLEMLRERVAKEVWFMVVAESAEATTEILNRIRVAGVPGKFSVASNGFTGFIVNREGEQFLKEEIRGC